jgi:tagatose 6-phosphate kinase
MNERILAVGATPTVQRTLRFAALDLGAVNRAREVLVTASGKAVNVARVAARLGGDSLLVQILGGDTGRFVARALDAEGVPHATVWLENTGPTRTCTTLLDDSGRTTELVEEAPPLDPAECARFEAECRDRLPGSGALCLSGSLPAGVPADFYAGLIEAAHGRDIPVLVDTQRAPLRAALAAGPFLVKPNREEAAATLGFALTGDPAADAEIAVSGLATAGAAYWALVSMGRAGSLLGNRDGGRWLIEPPRVEAVNPIGSGDSLAAGLLVALLRGASVPDAAVYGTACAAANCLSPTSGVVHPADVASLHPQVRRTELPRRA